jgi:DNA-binding CsgD family transcriptional regulator
MVGFMINARETSLLADIVAASREPSDRPLPWPVLELVKDLLHADGGVTFVGLDSTLPRIRFFQYLEASGEYGCVGETITEAQANPFWHRYWDPDKGCSYADRTGDYTFVRRDSDYQSLRQRRARHDGGADEEFFERLIQACLPARSPGKYCRVTGFRNGSDFTERDVFYLALLQPHFDRSYSAAVAAQCWLSPLSGRQLEIMRLVRAGLTNRQIAKRTGVTEGTIHNHLTHIFTRLKVQSRTAAVHATFDVADEWLTV